MKTINMPSFGADMDEGTLIEWQVKPGDTLTRGGVIAVIETNKGAIELDLFEDGVVDALLLTQGAKAKVGTPILRLRQQGDAPMSSRTEPENTVQNQDITQPPGMGSVPCSLAPHRPGHFIPASPAARRLAKEKGIALIGISGSGPQGAICLHDIQALLNSPSSPPTTPPQRETGPLNMTAMRQAITATVSRSKREIPHYYMSQTISITAVERQLTAYNLTLPPDERLLLIAPLLCAVARTLHRYPQFNGYLQDGQYQAATTVNLANAINLRGGGLLMPVIQEAECLDAIGMMRRLSELVDKARCGTLRHSELTGASCTVSSIGERGADLLLGVIYPPQVAIIGLGCPRSVPWVIEGEVQVGRVLTATLSADHRVSDGHQGALFLHELNKQLQIPEVLWTPRNYAH